MQKQKSAEFVIIKKLKKDGTINGDIIQKAASLLNNDKSVLLPVDNTYCVISTHDINIDQKIVGLSPAADYETVIISSFKMLNNLAVFSKSDYDFLNRIWPGDVSVILKRGGGKKIIIRFPKNKYIHGIIDGVERPVYAYASIDCNVVYRKKDILKNFSGTVDLIIIIEEFCKKHQQLTLIDISGDDLKFIRIGRSSPEEIKSLYFLGKADDGIVS